MWTELLIFLVILYFLRRYFNGPFSSLRKNMKGKIVIITGSSAGLGKESAFQLLEDGADVIFACRDKEKTIQVINSFKFTSSDTKTRAHFMKLDLTSFSDVTNFVAEFKNKFSKLDILMNNAGLFPTRFNLTKDNVESVFQANHLSHMILTFLLLDHFDKKEGKIINLSSYAHAFAKLSSNLLKDIFKSFSDYENYYFSGISSRSIFYSDTKLANIYFTQYLGNYLEKNITILKLLRYTLGLCKLIL